MSVDSIRAINVVHVSVTQKNGPMSQKNVDNKTDEVTPGKASEEADVMKVSYPPFLPIGHTQAIFKK
jgi:hypothetical protein